MPITAKLSRRFYEQLGDELANELVDWFNAVDFAYRADLLNLNETNFARFDAKLEQRLAEHEARWDGRFVQLEARLDHRFVQLEARLDHRFVELEARWDQRFVELEARWEQRFVELEARWEQRFVELEARWEQRFTRHEAHMTTALAKLRSDLLLWMFAFWTGSLLALAGFLFAVLRARG